MFRCDVRFATANENTCTRFILVYFGSDSVCVYLFYNLKSYQQPKNFSLKHTQVTN